jgi:hypothetical protein
MEPGQEDRDPKPVEGWVKVAEDEAKAVARAVEAVGVLDQAVTVSARVAERKLHTRWEPPVMSSNVQNAELL